MQTAASDDPATSTRRSAMRAGIAAALGALDAPAMATAAGNPDAELVRLCDRLVAIDAERADIFRTIEDDAEKEIALQPTDVESRKIAERLYDMPDPVTSAGARAVARAAFAEAEKSLDGGLVCNDISDWLALTVVEYVAKGGVA